jgi:hypothetical protein
LAKNGGGVVVTPTRLQLSRKKGFDLQAHSIATNGLPAVVVARPTKWGNPFRVVGSNGYADRAWAVAAHREYMCGSSDLKPDVNELRGKNLACWCDFEGPCHANTLLELANVPE